MKIKKLFIFLIAFVSIFTLMSCTKDNKANNTSTDTDDTESTYYLPTLKNNKTIKFTDSTIEVKAQDVYDYAKMNGGAELITNYIDYLLINIDNESETKTEATEVSIKTYLVELIKDSADDKTSTFYIGDEYLIQYYNENNDFDITEFPDDDNKTKSATLNSFIDEFLDFNDTKSGYNAALLILRHENNLVFYDRDFAYSYQKVLYSSYTSYVDYTTVENFDEDTDKNIIFSFNGTEYTADDFYKYLEDTEKIDEYIEDAAAISFISNKTFFKSICGENKTYKDLWLYKESVESIDDAIADNYNSDTYFKSEEFYTYVKYGTEDIEKAYDAMFIETAKDTYMIESILSGKASGSKTNVYQYEFKDSAIKSFVESAIAAVNNNVTEYRIKFSIADGKDDNHEIVNAIIGEIKTAIGSVSTEDDVVSAVQTYITNYNNASILDDISAAVKNAKLAGLTISKTTATASRVITNTEFSAAIAHDANNSLNTSNLIFVYGTKPLTQKDFTCILKYSETEGETTTDKQDTLNPWYNAGAAVTLNQLSQALYEYLMVEVQGEYDSDNEDDECNGTFTKFIYYENQSALFTDYINKIIEEYSSTFDSALEAFVDTKVNTNTD